MRSQNFFLIRGELKHKTDREAFDIASYLLVQSPGFYAVEFSQVRFKHNLLAAHLIYLLLKVFVVDLHDVCHLLSFPAGFELAATFSLSR